MSKVGIFSGTFDPVHKGHIAFALEAIRSGGLSDVYFLPEQQPRNKQGVTHYAHRVAMLRLALKPHKHLHLLELPDRRFDVARTLPRLKSRFADGFDLLMGSDTFSNLAQAAWPGRDAMLKDTGLVVGVRITQSETELNAMAEMLPADARVQFFITDNKHAASSDIRSALSRGKAHSSHLNVLSDYISANWLYCSVMPNNS